MKQRPILFSTPMVQAILAGRKTQTRRVVKPQPNFTYCTKCKKDYSFCACEFDSDEHAGRCTKTAKADINLCPYGKVGDVLWVRETFSPPTAAQLPTSYMYAADYPVNPLAKGIWKPSIHMPKEACRLFLEITDICVERLQDITEENAIAEGISRYPKAPIYGYKHYMHNDMYCLHAIESFYTLWHSINGEESLKANPWVWVLEFKRISL